MLKKAWSIRLMLLAGILSGAEAIMPLLAPKFASKSFAIATFFVVAAAFGSRLLAQKSMDDDD